MTYLCIAFAVLFPYLICSINPAIVVTRLKSGKDIRDLGSGNPGLTNVLRTQGKAAAVIVLLFDVLKGVVAIWGVALFREIVYPVMWQTYSINGYFDIEFPTIFNGMFYRMSGDFYLCIWIAALAALLGHCFPIWHKFKGGKAVLVTVTTLFVIDWFAALILLTLFILIVAITRYVSLGSCVTALLYPVCVGLTHVYYIGWGTTDDLGWKPYAENIIPIFFAAIIGAVIIFKHRENIKRLIKGTEKKLGKKETS